MLPLVKTKILLIVVPLLSPKVTGSEIVGLIPKEALLMAATAYGAVGDETARIDAAVKGLALSDLAPFAPREKVIELSIEEA